MQSGECRWIGREDVHVYCKAPMVEVAMPSGRKGWNRGPRWFAVICPAAGLPAAASRDQFAWQTADEAAAVIEEILGRP
jgi:hypothetical protein